MPMRKRKKKRNRHHPVLKTIGILFLILLIACASFAVYCMVTAPDISVLDARPQSYRSVVLDTGGNTIQTLSGEASNRVYVTLDQIPENLQHAFVAVEDERFYTHHGVDFYGVMRAFVHGITTGNFSQGASTITQQLLKNNVFTDWTDEKTFLDKLVRKVQEQFLAIRLENTVDKDWILENYLNTVNLGGGNWGVETAARYYFNKDVSELDLAESAVLAGITKNPSAYNPLKYPENNAKRQKIVLDDMLTQGYITQDEYNAASSEDVYTEIQNNHTSNVGDEVMNYFEDALVTRLINDLQVKTGCTEADAWNKLYKGGLTIYSTENSALQSSVESIANDDGLFINDAQVSIVVINNENGAVCAMVGGRGEKTGSLVYNRATSETRQPGSTIKILGEYSAGLENGKITLASCFDDAPYTYSDGTPVSDSDGTYAGKMPVRDAIAQSKNIVALKVFQDVTLDAVWNQLAAYGLDTLTDADKVEALALGGTSGGVTNLDMTAAYSSIERLGAYIAPTYYTKVVDHDGNTLLAADTSSSKRTVSESTARLLTSAMEDVISSGTGADISFDKAEVAGKSGTSSNVTDAWFIGYSSYYTCGVWGGYDDHSPQESSGYTHQIWREVMVAAHNGLGYTQLEDADSMTTALVCAKCGKLAVSGTCDRTAQGDMTRTEYFADGTAPTESCDCHVKICTVSDRLANDYCPTADTSVYLREATAGTADEGYSVPSWYDISDICTVHTQSQLHNWWTDTWNGGSDTESQDSDNAASSEENPENEDHGGDQNGADSRQDSESSGETWWNQAENWWNNTFG